MPPSGQLCLLPRFVQTTESSFFGISFEHTGQVAVDVADQVSQLRAGSSASDQVFFSDSFSDDLLAHFVANVQSFQPGFRPQHIVCAVGHDEFTKDAVKGRAQVEVQSTPALSTAFAEVCYLLDHLAGQGAPALRIVNELHVIFLDVVFSERTHVLLQVNSKPVCSYIILSRFDSPLFL